MLKKIITILVAILFTFNVNASSDGELLLKKNQPSEVKDCFEKINRGFIVFILAQKFSTRKP